MQTYIRDYIRPELISSYELVANSDDGDLKPKGLRHGLTFEAKTAISTCPLYHGSAQLIIPVSVSLLLGDRAEGLTKVVFKIHWTRVCDPFKEPTVIILVIHNVKCHTLGPIIISLSETFSSVICQTMFLVIVDQNHQIILIIMITNGCWHQHFNRWLNNRCQLQRGLQVRKGSILTANLRDVERLLK